MTTSGSGHASLPSLLPSYLIELQDIVALFASKDTVNNFNAFTNWWDTKAAVALAKVGRRAAAP